MTGLKIRSLIDDKKKQRVRDAIARGDTSIFGMKKKVIAPLAEPIFGANWSRLDISKVDTMVLFANMLGVPAWEAVGMAGDRKVIIPNAVHDRILLGSEPGVKSGITGCYSAWTGTAIIFESPGERFRESVEYNWRFDFGDGATFSLTFQVPEKFRGKTGCAMVINHPDFDFQKINEHTYLLKARNDNAIALIEDFPEESGWYHFENRFHIPVGKKLDIGLPIDVANTDNAIRRLTRDESSCYAGLVIREIAGARERGLRHQILCDNSRWGLGAAAIDREVYESLKRGDRP